MKIKNDDINNKSENGENNDDKRRKNLKEKLIELEKQLDEINFSLNANNGRLTEDILNR